jgi:hypothetical protein
VTRDSRLGSTLRVRRPLPQVESTYLGFPLLIGERTVTVLTPDGRHVAEVRGLATARNVVRAYRRPLKNAEPAASLAKATAGSDSHGG